MSAATRTARWCALVLALALLPAVAGSAHASGHALRRPRLSKVSLLYVVNAGAGTLSQGPRHRLILTLTGVEGHAVWFADRPVRRSGSFPASGFPSAWRGFGFASRPPNAALDYTDPVRGPDHTVILELFHPRIRRHHLVFTVRILDPSAITSGDLVDHARRADRTPPQHLIAPSLFIDDTIGIFAGGCYLIPYTACDDADLSGTNLAGAQLADAEFVGSDLQGADLTNADLSNVSFQDAKLQNANLTDTDLSGADFECALMGGADVTRAEWNQTTLPDGAVAWGPPPPAAIDAPCSPRPPSGPQWPGPLWPASLG